MSDHLTVPQVLSWNPGALTEQATEWDRQAAAVRDRMEAEYRAVDASRDTFQGAAGDAMRDRFEQVYEKSRKVVDVLTTGADTAKVASMNFSSAKSLVQHQKQTSEAKGLRVDEDGTCNITERAKQSIYSSVGGDENKYNTAMAALELDCNNQTVAMKNTLQNAADTDNDAVTAINKAFADMPAADSFGNATTPASDPKKPPKDGSPRENRAWWDSLTPQEQGEMVSTQPASVGNLDGLPADVRDQANRNRIPMEEARLNDEVRKADSEIIPNPRSDFEKGTNQAAERKAEDARNRLGDLQGIKKSLQAKQGQSPRKLMMLDMQSGRQGRAAVAVGDPDNADHVSVTTPGLGSNTRESLPGMVDEADNLKSESERQLSNARRGDESVSTIAWFGYDPPQGGLNDPELDTANVAWEGRAQEGAKPLANFYDGIDVASNKNDPHVTALGHSYGSLTTSLALQEKGGGVDDAVFYGSPGLGGHVPALGASGLGAIVSPPVGTVATETGLNDTVDNAGDLGLKDHHVYEMSEHKDPIANADRFGRSPNKMDWVQHLSTDPITTDNGDYSGSTGHSGYPQTDTKTGNMHRSGYNLAAIVAGLPGHAIDGRE